MSISRFTRDPAASSPSVVTSRVCGIRLTPKTSSSTSLTVSDTPSTVIEPFGAMNRCSGLGARIRRRCEPPSLSTDSTSPTPSTWPETMWPPSSSPTRAARSRLIRRPFVQPSSVVSDRVSPETSTANQSAPFSTTVRQQPAWLTEAPISRVVRSKPVSISKRRSRLVSRTLFTRPRSVTIPVNISGLLVALPKVVADLADLGAPEVGRLGQRRNRQGAKRRPPLAADQQRRAEPLQGVDEPAAHEAGGHLTAALDEEA